VVVDPVDEIVVVGGVVDVGQSVVVESWDYDTFFRSKYRLQHGLYGICIIEIDSSCIKQVVDVGLVIVVGGGVDVGCFVVDGVAIVVSPLVVGLVAHRA
jgi:hypothetical protein